MATFAELTDEQQAAVQQLAVAVRKFSGELARLGNHGRAVANLYAGNVENILSGVGDNDVIPNASGYANSQSLTKTELVNLIGYLMVLSDTGDNVSGSYNSNYHRGLYAKAAGVDNIVG